LVSLNGTRERGAKLGESAWRVGGGGVAMILSEMPEELQKANKGEKRDEGEKGAFQKKREGEIPNEGGGAKGDTALHFRFRGRREGDACLNLLI